MGSLEKQVEAIHGAVQGLANLAQGSPLEYQLLNNNERWVIHYVGVLSQVLREQFPYNMSDAGCLPITIDDHSKKLLPEFVAEFIQKELAVDSGYRLAIVAHSPNGIHLNVLGDKGLYRSGISVVSTINDDHVEVYVETNQNDPQPAVVDAQNFITLQLNRGTLLQRQRHHLEAAGQILFFVGTQLSHQFGQA